MDEDGCTNWNYALMRHHGLDLETATLLSDAGVSWHDALPMIEGHCPTDLILRILMPSAWVEGAFPEGAWRDPALPVFAPA